MPLRQRSSEGPLDRVPIQAVLHVEVVGDVGGIVISGERLVAHRVIERCGGQHEEKTEKNIACPVRLERAPVGQGVVCSFELRLTRSHFSSKGR